MAEEHRHHIVSRGYQRFFADGELVLLCDKTRPARGPQVRPAGTSSVFVAEHFNSYREEGRWITHLERAWRTVENPCLPSLRSWVNGNEWIEGGGSGLPSRDAAKLLAAIHFARSSFFKQIYDRISKEGLEWAVQVLPTDPELLLRWQRVFKSAPNPGQVEDEIRKNFDPTFGPHGRYVLERMVHTYELAITKLEQLYVQALFTSQRGIDFILGDSPLVYYTEDELRVGGRSGLALGDAQHIFLPIGPSLAVMFCTSHHGDVVLDPATVQKLNNLSWRAADAQVICHPSTNYREAIAGRVLAFADGPATHITP